MDTEGNNYIRGKKKKKTPSTLQPTPQRRKRMKYKVQKNNGLKIRRKKKDLKGKITLEKRENKRRSLGVTSHLARGKKEERGVTASKREENKGKK